MMSSGKSKRCTRSIINNEKERKLPAKRCVKSQKKKPKCSKSVCEPVANIKTVTDNHTLNNSGPNSLKSPPYVRLERLNFDKAGLIPYLSYPVTKDVEISKSPKKKTKIKEKNIIPHVKELDDTSSNQSSFKKVKLCSSNKNHNSSNNDSLCDINSASSLFADVHEISRTETKDKDFSSDIFKMKPITENSVCNCDNGCVSVIFEASVVARAFEFYKWQKKLKNLPSSSISTNDLPVENLSYSNQPRLEADNSSNEETVSKDLFHIAEEEIPQSFVEPSHKIVRSELHLGAVVECMTTASDNSAGADSKSVLQSPVRGRIFPQSLRKRAESLSIDKDADFFNDILDSFQDDNDLNLKICDVRGSDEVFQHLIEDNDQINMNEMSIGAENENHSYVSNDDQYPFSEHEGIEPSCESLEKADVVLISGSNQMGSNQPLNPPLNCNISTVNEENNSVFSVEKPDAFDSYVQLPDDKKSSSSIASEPTNDVHEKISVSLDELSQNNVEDTTNDSYEFERVSFTKPDEQNSSSKGFHEKDIFNAEEVLDYEPEDLLSEASELDMSDTESGNGEIQAKQSHSDSKIPIPENLTDNAIEVHEIQSDSYNNKILKDSYTGQHVKDSLFIRQEDELDFSNTTENSSDKVSMESVQNNDTLVNQTAHRSPPNNNDECGNFQSNPHANYDQANFFDSFVSEHVYVSLEKSSETSNKEFDEINNTGNEEKDPSSFQFDKEHEVNCHQKQQLKTEAESSRKRKIDSEDDSESDSEHSFKRKTSNDYQGFGFNEEENSVDEFSQSKVDPFLVKFKEVLFSIQENCKNGKIDDALQLANKYIPISAGSVQKDIFTELFFGLMESFRNSNPPLMEDLSLDTMKNTMEIFYDFNLYKTEDLNLYDTTLCSDIIAECLSLKLTSLYGQQLFAFCQKNGFFLDFEAVKSYIDIIKPSEMSLTELITFLNFISKCNVPLPKFIMKEMLNLLFQNQEDISVNEITEIGELLCCLGSSEIAKNDIKKFVKLCIKKRFWTQIAHLICAWTKKVPITTCVIEALASHLEDAGFWYEELAKEIYGPGGSVPLQARFIFGQMGVRLLMEASFKKDYDSAFDILLILHRYNINYVDYQAPLYHADWYIKAVPNPTKIFVFPFTVAFTALDVCLHLERPKDAFMIFKSFSLDLPNEFDETFKLEIRSRRFHYLLKITLALQSKDPLGKGIDALRALLSSAQKDFALELLSEFSKDLEVAYNKYMVCVLNAEKENLIKEFYAYFHPQKELYTLDCQVLRGLIVFFVKRNMLDEANKLLNLGYLRKMYEFRKPVMLMPPWQMTVDCDWTSEEIKLAFLKFAETLTPVLKSKKKTDDFDKWFSVQILIKNVPKVDYEVDCLNDCSSALKRVCSTLKGLDLKIQSKLGKNKQSVHLVPEFFYNFWFSKFAVSCLFTVPGKVRVSFGESSTRERSECSTRIFDIGSSEAVDNCLMAETFNSDDRRLDDENVSSDDSACLTTQNVPAVPQNPFRNNHSNKMFCQESVLKNVAYFSPERTGSTSQQGILPHSPDNNDMLGINNISPKSNTPIHLSPRRSISSTPPRTENRISSSSTPYLSPRRSISSTPPRTENRISSSSTPYLSPRRSISSTPPRPENHISSSSTPYLSPQKNVVTTKSPQKSFLQSPNRIVSPGAQRKSPQTFSPRNSDITLSNATSENTDQNCSFRTNLNFSDSGISAQNGPAMEQSPNLINYQQRTPPGSIKTGKPKVVLKNCKKTIPTKTALVKKRHSASCSKNKKVNSTLLKAKSRISMLPSDLKDIQITLQNDSAQSEAQRIVKPASGVRPGIQASGVRPGNNASGVRPGIKASQVDSMDCEESNFQCNVSEEVFQKIINFLKSKVMVKRKDLTPQRQQRKALGLAQAFIQTNVVVNLDKRNMKLLCDFADECI